MVGAKVETTPLIGVAGECAKEGQLRLFSPWNLHKMRRGCFFKRLQHVTDRVGGSPWLLGRRRRATAPSALTAPNLRYAFIGLSYFVL